MHAVLYLSVIVQRMAIECYSKCAMLKDVMAKVCFLTASELYYKEFRKKGYNALEKDLFIRKPIENEKLVKEMDRLIARDVRNT
jgi:hypothetical protein